MVNGKVGREQILQKKVLMVIIIVSHEILEMDHFLQPIPHRKAGKREGPIPMMRVKGTAIVVYIEKFC